MDVNVIKPAEIERW